MTKIEKMNKKYSINKEETLPIRVVITKIKSKLVL